MRKSNYLYLLLAVMVLYCNVGFSITALEVFNQGRRAFDLGRWQEAGETFTKFMATWPDHKLKSEALYYFSISSARTLSERSRQYSDTLADDIVAAIGTLSIELPEKDLTELRVAVDLSQNPEKPSNWTRLSSLSPIELKHYLSRGWHPDPIATPMETIYWHYTWFLKNKNGIAPDLQAQISLIKSRALWQILLSPLSLAANSDILKTWGCWPVYKSFEDEVNKGFQHGSPEIKRELALLGYHYDCFRRGGFAKADSSPLKSRWYIYLSERGINLQEAWCPR